MRRGILLFSVGLAVGLGAMMDAAYGQCCGDCDGSGDVAVNELVTAVNRALSGCLDDDICSAASCPGQLAECRGDLTSCLAHREYALLATGQTTDYGPGSDGDLRAGAVLSYTDNGDGTVTDNNTGLMWEKKSNDGSVHDVDNTYTWGMTSAPYTMDGTMVTEFLATLNRPPCFAGHCDWRIPNVRELQSIVDYQVASPGPSVRVAFNTNCSGGCAVTMCSCTASELYLTSTTGQGDGRYAWYVHFRWGVVDYGYDFRKDTPRRVRAVRGGL